MIESKTCPHDSSLLVFFKMDQEILYDIAGYKFCLHFVSLTAQMHHLCKRMCTFAREL